MTRTVVAFDNAEARGKVAGMLEKADVQVRYQCGTGGEAAGAVKTMGGGVVICGYRLRDMSADDLADELEGLAYLLVMATPPQLELLGSGTAFRMPLPVTPGEFRGSVNILLQMDEIRSRRNIPRRSEADEAVITEAKVLLMQRNFMTESEAHRYLQHKSMESAMKMADMARKILNHYKNEARK